MPMNDAQKQRHEEAKAAILVEVAAILAEVKKIDPKAKCAQRQSYSAEGHTFTIHVDGRKDTLDLEIKPQRDSRSSFTYVYYNGKYDIVVSRYPLSKRFKSRRDGVPHAEIAAEMFELSKARAIRIKNEEAARAATEAQEDQVDRMREAFKLSFNPYLRTKNGALSVEIFGKTPEQMRAILETLSNANLL
jgi:hypothetical protein